MTEPVNLNRARKARDRAAAKTEAAQNRVRFGQAKGDRSLAARLKDKADGALDGAKREP